MNNNRKFSLILSILVFTSLFLNIKAQDFSNKIPDIPSNYESEYANQICAGDDNIIQAGCTVIAGQVVRGIPAMAFGASFDTIKNCVKKMESRSGTTARIDLDDTCNQFGLLNPKLDSSKFVYENSGIKNDASLLGISKNLHNLNQDIVKNSFDINYFAYKGIENIPVAKNAFAQSPDARNLGFPGNWLITVTYNTWVTVRNVSYALLGLLSIVLGLTLMSSNSIFDSNAKWRLSLEQAIPRVIIAIVLIQFSYLLGESIFFIADQQNFEPILRYIFTMPEGGWVTYATGGAPLSPSMILGAVLARLVDFVFGGAFLIALVIFGLWYLWRLLVLWWYNLSVNMSICIFTIASPFIIAMSLLPGEAGAQQTKRYFSTLLSLISRTFLLQAITVAPTIIVWTLTANDWAAGFYNNSYIFSILTPIILGIIVLGYADNVQNLSNQFAKNVTGADPIGG